MKKFFLRGIPEHFARIDLGHTGRALRRYYQEGWYMQGDQPSIDRARLMGCTYSTNIWTNMIGGSYYTGLLLLMNVDDAFMGLMTMVPFATNILQMFAPLLLERFPRRRTLLTVLRAVMMALNMLIVGLIPIFPVAYQSKLVILFFVTLAVNALNAFISPGLTVWHLQSIPPRVRNSFYSRLNMTNGIVVALLNLGTGALVDAFKQWGMEYQGLLSLRIAALAFAAFDTWQYCHISEYPYESDNSRFTLKELIVSPFKQRLYLCTVAVAFMWNLTANIPGPYYTAYLLKNVEVSYSYLMLVNFLNVPIVMLLAPLWSRVLSRFSWFKTLYLALAVYVFHLVGYCFVTKETIFLYPVSAVVCFVMSVGINLAFAGIPFCNLPQKKQTVYIGFYSTMCNLGALLGVYIGRSFIGATEGLTFSLLGAELINKQYLLLLTAAMESLMAVAVWQIQRRIPRPEA